MTVPDGGAPSERARKAGISSRISRRASRTTLRSIGGVGGVIVEEDELVEGVPSSEDMAIRRSRTGWLPASKIEKESIPAPSIEDYPTEVDTVPANHSRSRRQHSRQKRRLPEHEVLAHSRACV